MTHEGKWCLGVWLEEDETDKVMQAFQAWQGLNGFKRFYAEKNSGKDITFAVFLRELVAAGCEKMKERK
jgi:hypothetical protein